jgi:predicted nucleic-acid-binding Zn-ribbon protein
LSSIYYIDVAGQPLHCPVCGAARFRTKTFRVTGQWLQAFDLEGFGREGTMAICADCSHIQHFANAQAVKTRTSD